jgi:hypothetical protein
MQKALEIVIQTMAEYESALDALRLKYDETDSNHPMVQVVIAQDIALVAAKLDAMKHLYKILGGV